MRIDTPRPGWDEVVYRKEAKIIRDWILKNSVFYQLLKELPEKNDEERVMEIGASIGKPHR